MRKLQDSPTGDKRFGFSGILVSVNPEVRKMNNEKQTEYLIGTVEFENVNGKPISSPAIIYKNNWKYGMEIGKKYLCTATKLKNPTDPEKGIIITVSHLRGGDTVKDEDFGFEAEEVLTSDLVPTTN